MIPRPPAWLSKDARAEWKRLAPVMSERKTLTPGDLAAFTSLCVAYGEFVEASREIKRDGGMTYKTASGLVKKHPAVGIRNNAITQIRLLSSELGLTPAARSRAAAHDDAEDDDEFDI